MSYVFNYYKKIAIKKIIKTIKISNELKLFQDNFV